MGELSRLAMVDKYAETGGHTPSSSCGEALESSLIT